MSASPSPIETWQRLLDDDHAALRDAASAVTPGDVAAIARLRKKHSLEIVHAALSLAEARRKAQKKMPGSADRLIATPRGVEMASSQRIAAYKAGVLASAGGPIYDLGCGIGGDAIELAARAPTTAVDLDPLAAWMCARNAACEALTTDITTLAIPASAAVHIDPSRRDGAGRRKLHLDDMDPPPDAVRAIVEKVSTACVKLAPGVDPTDLAEGQSEWISEQGTLTQGLLWRGVDHASGAPRIATMLTPGDSTFTVAGEPKPAPSSREHRAFVHTMDPALERARLAWIVAERHGLRTLDNAGTGLLTGDAPVDDPWLTPFAVLERLAWSPRGVRARLADLNAGLVAVKTRGGSVDADKAQAELRGTGERPLVVFIQRLGGGIEALITERTSADSDAASSVHADGR